MVDKYVITGTQPYTYLDGTRSVVEGFRVFFHLPAFDEAHYVQVPSLNKDTVKNAIEARVKQREDLSTF
jgi:hypothetical protein